MLQLRREGTYSVKDISSLCKISVTTYYLICKREDNNEWPYIRPRGRQFTAESLQPPEKEYIKHMADAPEKSYTVPEMCKELADRFQRTISRKKVYTYLTKTLKYSYKRNNYKAQYSFEPEQAIVKYKVCKALLGYLEQDKHIIYIDESGFGLDMHPEYSYAKRGCRPYRIGQSKSKRLNLIMGITNQNVFAYQIRKGAHNEHSFISFLLDITRKAYELGPDYVNNVVLFMDNARFHRSTLVRKLMSLLPFPILFNAPCWCELNPIEMVFGIVKRRLKRQHLMNM